MSDYTLIIGNKNYSSWSLRPWLAMKVAGIAFTERLIPLWDENWQENIAVSPSKRVPVPSDVAMAPSVISSTPSLAGLSIRHGRLPVPPAA